ncbi:MAG TPA: glycosyltransferase, partial [Acidimicrobiales bacterium]|nr:glycosyltransferase [Acidimicrobiales bacterium]
MPDTLSSPRPLRIDQVVPSFAGRDAIGVHVLHTRDALRDAGYASDIWAIDTLPEMRAEARSVDELSSAERPRSWWIYHHSIGTPAAEILATRTEPLILDYHNITPAELVDRWAPWVRDEVELGRKQLSSLAQRCFFALADSSFNETELVEAGYSYTRVVPPLFDLASFEHSADRQVQAELRARKAEGGSDWLFVGRVAPHKAQHELIKTLAVHRRLHDPHARLHLVGTAMGKDYSRALERFAQRIGVGDAVNLTGMLSDEALAAYYQAADLFVCASEHEGFCVPVVEAMHLGVPVIAHAAAAVPETVDGAALLLDDFSPLATAVAANRVANDRRLRELLVAAGRERARYFSIDKAKRRLVDAMDAALSSAVGH